MTNGPGQLTDRPMALPILSPQPRPLKTRVVHFRFLGFVATAIMRHWRPGDSGPGGRCRLCPECRAYDDGCLMVFGKRIPKTAAPLTRSADAPYMDAAVVDKLGLFRTSTNAS